VAFSIEPALLHKNRDTTSMQQGGMEMRDAEDLG